MSRAFVKNHKNSITDDYYSNQIRRKRLRFEEIDLTLHISKHISFSTADSLETVPAYPYLTQKISKIIKELKYHDSDHCFFKPVKVHGYNETIKHPIHFNDILTKINRKQYVTVGDILSDIDLIWKNCWKFNGRPDYIHDSTLFSFPNFASDIQWVLDQYIESFKNELINKKYLSLNCEKMKVNKKENSQIIHWNMLSKPLYIDSVNTFDNVRAFPFLTENIKKIINKIKLLDTKGDFFEDPVKLIGIGYLKCIEKPMHFGEILERIGNREYQRMREIKNDIELVFSNCYKFNEKNHAFVVWAEGLELSLKGYMNEYINLLKRNGYIKQNVIGKKRHRDLCKLIVEPNLKKHKIV